MTKHFGSRLANVALRVLELCSSAVVLGEMGALLSRVHRAHGPNSGRIIYTEVVAALSLLTSIFLILPFMYVFYAWAWDLIMFILWLIAFCLLISVTHNHECSSVWFRNYWGFYWHQVNVCTNWRVVLSFCGIAWILFFFSFLVGVYAFTTRRDEGHMDSMMTKPDGSRRFSFSKQERASQPTATTAMTEQA